MELERKEEEKTEVTINLDDILVEILSCIMWLQPTAVNYGIHVRFHSQLCKINQLHANENRCYVMISAFRQYTDVIQSDVLLQQLVH